MADRTHEDRPTGRERFSGCCAPAEFDAALAFKALGHPTRMSILRSLATCDARCCGEVCAELPLAQSTVSQHLDMMCKAGIVRMHQTGTRSCYSLNRQALVSIAAMLAALGEETAGEAAS